MSSRLWWVSVVSLVGIVGGASWWFRAPEETVSLREPNAWSRLPNRVDKGMHEPLPFDTLALAKTVWEPLDEGVALTMKGETRWYPIPVLRHLEVVNDTVAGTPVAVVYTTHVRAPQVFARPSTEPLFPSDRVWNGIPLLTDAQGSLWNPVSGEGEGEATTLASLPFSRVFWDEWVLRAPSTAKVLSYTATDGDLVDSPLPPFEEEGWQAGPVVHADTRLPWMTRVTGLLTDPEHRVFPHSLCSATTSAFVDQDVIWFCDLENDRVYAFRADSNTNPLTLPTKHEEIPLTELPTTETFWYAWLATFPDTHLFSP